MWKLLSISFCFILVNSESIFPSECGMVTDRLSLRIIGGDEADEGDFPWLAVWCHGMTTRKCFCAGSLITSRHVVTAAHCIKPKWQTAPYWPGTLLHFGRHDLASYLEESQTSEILDARIHPDWRPKAESYDADIAVLYLERTINFTDFIQPICLPPPGDYAGGKGTIAGWGVFNETKEGADILQYTHILAIKNEDCWNETSPWLEYISSNRSFCAGNPGSANPCSGDSGGGFYTGTYYAQYLQGIISASYFYENGICDTSKNAVFTNVGHFVDWIHETVAEEWKYLQFIASFYKEFNGPYKCFAYVPRVTTRNTKVMWINGRHDRGFSNREVTWLVIRNDTRVDYIPGNIGAITSNLEIFELTYNYLKAIDRENFQFMDKLWNLDLTHNRISSLDEKIFNDVVNMQKLVLNENKLSALPQKLLWNLKKIQTFEAKGNEIEIIDSEFFVKNLNMRWVNLANNKLRKISFDFTKLMQLGNLFLNENVCIDKNFTLQNDKMRKEMQIEIRGA